MPLGKSSTWILPSIPKSSCYLSIQQLFIVFQCSLQFLDVNTYISSVLTFNVIVTKSVIQHVHFYLWLLAHGCYRRLQWAPFIAICVSLQNKPQAFSCFTCNGTVLLEIKRSESILVAVLMHSCIECLLSKMTSSKIAGSFECIRST